VTLFDVPQFLLPQIAFSSADARPFSVSGASGKCLLLGVLGILG
jgi:hypothetical protein